MKSVPLATAAQIYHRFFQETELQDYDPHVSTRYTSILTRRYSCGKCGYRLSYKNGSHSTTAGYKDWRR